MTTTSAPIGSTAQSLDGFAVDANVVAAFRESVVITGPNVSTEVIVPTSTQPIDVYALPTWLLGTPSVSVAAMPAAAAPTGTTQVFGNVSSFAVNVVSSFAVNNPATVSTQVISSIPLIVAQSSAPWDVRGNVGVTSQTAVASTWPLNTTMANIVSSVPLTVNPHALTGTSQVFGTVSTQVVSSVPIYVVQSSAPWFFVETVSSNAGVLSTTVRLLATLNTTVIKAGKGNLYGYSIQNMASTSLNVKLCNASSAVIASTAVLLYQVGLGPSTSAHISMDMGVTFSTGIVMFTTRESWPQGITAPLGSTATVTLTYF